MENNKLASLMVASLFSVLGNSQIEAQNELNDSLIFESAIKPFEMHTCGQCNQPTEKVVVH